MKKTIYYALLHLNGNEIFGEIKTTNKRLFEDVMKYYKKFCESEAGLEFGYSKTSFKDSE